ncbi:MAG TPA: 5'/3'-nucleotidase SurE [Anaerohalosphaeraceae bacterium]|jgi:5'-nucleotidase|nr:5'/3'-nucleotidase SurE [Phycisphaerae bacterium]HOT73663.1 5'/3'-nucleotidase SurE [Anaerohalosphaeraceae bacterium]HQG06940.1 5'/3'-nucleotidase SurE [Anaerohalosphaeraceae bacterium]HQI08310.1 5'/3'-nucleotidase SurE [Anaerohalosphaeraceae bacterium]HQJ68641.1 5'/3'-nucleotidase SurE [Anaerohalosphaeraceae bacterium]
MHILLTNDDGIFAPGLAAMYSRLCRLGKVTVVAPADVQSGAGHSISLREIRCDPVEIVGKFSGFCVEGSPADCVKLAMNELIDENEPVDLLISGINCGANVGINIFYSGTVAGAIEGAFYGLPAVAVSAAADEPMNYEAAADYALEVLTRILPLSAGQVVNLNIPRLSEGRPKGVLVVPQSTHGFEESYHIDEDANGQGVYRLKGGPHRDPHAEEPATDTQALAAGFITLTGLRLDLTDLTINERLKKLSFLLETK